MKKIAFLLSFCLGTFSCVLSQELPEVLITYYSQSGSTKTLAESIANGAKSVEGIKVTLLPIDQVTSQNLLNARAIIVGSPVYNANIAPPVQEFINAWPFEGRPLKNKIGAAFSTGGGISIGEELVMLNILHSMLIHGMIVMGGEETEAAFGASAVKGEVPFDSGEVEDLFFKKGFGLGSRVAKMVLAFPGVVN
jgi:NAD(P)H dehydrogenase (quinone)